MVKPFANDRLVSLLRWRRVCACVCLLGVAVLSGCVSGTSEAPVVNGWSHTDNGIGMQYTVKAGDTVYSVAWTFGLDYRSLVSINQLTAPFTIHPGQKLFLHGAAATARGTIQHGMHRLPVAHSTSDRVIKYYSADQPDRQAADQSKQINTSLLHQKLRWVRPATGVVIDSFSKTPRGNKGWDISGRLGDQVRASAAGDVVYAGSGVRGYGNLVIVKHNNRYLSAYAYNQTILVSTGQQVKAGQRIATMGRNSAGKAMLHFEIRKDGKPVNPAAYIHR